MKHFLFIFLLTCPLWVFSSCEDKLPGSKPEIFFGKWEHSYDYYWSYTTRHIVETYEFTKKGGSYTRFGYSPDDEQFKLNYISKLADWSYDGKDIHFKDTDGGLWYQPVYGITQDSLLLGSGPAYTIFFRIKE